jgi:hypothetical protein
MGRMVGALLGLLLLTSNARAQEVPTWLRVKPSYVAYEAVALPSKQDGQRRRAAWMVAIGTGLLFGGAAYGATMAPRGGWCHDERERVDNSLPITFALTGAGAALITAGAVRMARRSAQWRARPLQIGLMAAATALIAGTAFVTPLYANPGTYSCI